ncbi:hypothetical protein ACMSSJ_11300 [Kerstersia gyiorum]|uniref:hypothetical protein n=1 Tax=Kerstersia gyiorum TaxID=206506 RepID=UPI0039EB3A94
MENQDNPDRLNNLIEGVMMDITAAKNGNKNKATSFISSADSHLINEVIGYLSSNNYIATESEYQAKKTIEISW